MSLIDEKKELCVRLTISAAGDGMGGYDGGWTEGAEFLAAIVKGDTVATRTAEKQDIAERFTVTVDKGLVLDFHDVFRRKSDGAVFRVTSNIKDSETPPRATFQIGQVYAERWELP